MKAITICQPYAHLICLPDDHSIAKRVENRTWPTSYRGPLLIHAGKSREWLATADTRCPEVPLGIPLADLVFGKIVAVCSLIDCVAKERSGINGFTPAVLERHPWLAMHKHAHGPYCFILANVRPLENPVPYRGQQGLFNVTVGNALKGELRKVNFGYQGAIR